VSCECEQVFTCILQVAGDGGRDATTGAVPTGRRLGRSESAQRQYSRFRHVHVYSVQRTRRLGRRQRSPQRYLSANSAFRSYPSVFRLHCQRSLTLSVQYYISPSRVAGMLDSGAEGPGFKSQSRCCRVTVLGKLFTPFVCLCSPSSKIGSSSLKDCGGNCRHGGK